eukprot:2062748-Heterocapsa_arctica.AAC.1
MLFFLHTHKRGTHFDSDHSEDENDDLFPGYRIRKDAYNRMVEKHKDKLFQPNEEKNKKAKNIIKVNQLKDKESQDDENKVNEEQAAEQGNDQQK